MNFKEKLLKHKKMLIGSTLSVLAGAIIGFNGMVSKTDYNVLLSQKAETTSKIEIIQQDLDTKNQALASLEAARVTMTSELNELVKAKQEKLAKEEAARIEAEKKAEQEKIAKKEQEKINIQTNSGNNNSDNNPSTDGSSNTSNETQTTPIGQMVWKTTHGKKYHNKSKCGNSKTSVQVTLEQAKNSGLTACKTCYY